MRRDRFGPEPLTRRRRPWRTEVRAALWRWRFVAVALGVAMAASAVLEVVRPAPPATTPVVVAARDVAAGTTLAAADLRVVRLPTALVAEGASARADDLIGDATAVPVPAGLPIVPGVLATAGIAGPPGTVVAAVRLADPAVAAYLVPGTRIDLIAATPETPGVVVASRALVLPRPAVADDSWDATLTGDEAPPVLVAVTQDEAQELSGAAVSSALSAVVVP